MTIDKDKITEIFFMAYNFCQLYDRFIKINGLARKRDKSKRKYHRGSTALRVCRNQRIHLHKVFKGLAQRGQCSMGWFYGFKLHLICNEKGDLLNFMLTPGNVDDREPLRNKSFIEQIFGKLVGDKGYICKDLFSKLFVTGFTVNLMAGLAAYSFFPKKPMIDIDRVSPCENGLIQLSLF